MWTNVGIGGCCNGLVISRHVHRTVSVQPLKYSTGISTNLNNYGNIWCIASASNFDKQHQ